MKNKIIKSTLRYYNIIIYKFDMQDLQAMYNELNLEWIRINKLKIKEQLRLLKNKQKKNTKSIIKPQKII